MAVNHQANQLIKPDLFVEMNVVFWTDPEVREWRSLKGLAGQGGERNLRCGCSVNGDCAADTPSGDFASRHATEAVKTNEPLEHRLGQHVTLDQVGA